MDIHNSFFSRTITKDFHSNTYYNQVLFESENFVVIPSLGSLVAGWVLIVPKTYALNMGQLSEALLTELENLATKVSVLIEKDFGPVTMFEHGPVASFNQVGCGVDYAHLHLVPININLIQHLAEASNASYEWEELDNISELTSFASRSMPYLFVSTEAGLFAASDENIPSQLFRRIIANHLLIPEQFDWKFNPKVENIQCTINALSPYNGKLTTKSYHYEQPA